MMRDIEIWMNISSCTRLTVVTALISVPITCIYLNRTGLLFCVSTNEMIHRYLGCSKSSVLVCRLIDVDGLLILTTRKTGVELTHKLRDLPLAEVINIDICHLTSRGTED